MMITLEQILYILPVVGLTISILYYAMILRNANKTQRLQLETRQAQLFMSIYSKWTDKIHLDWGEIRHWEWNDYEDFMQKYGDSESWAKVNSVGSFYEGIGILVREGLIPIRLPALFITSPCKSFIEKFNPIAKRMRVITNSPRIAIESEYLYNQLLKYWETHPEIED